MAIKKIAALDLFSGAGGFSLGMEQSGVEVVVAIEYDEKIANTYKANHPNTFMINEDIKKVPASIDDEIFDKDKQQMVVEDFFIKKNKSIDIIFGGPPCQGFSMAGTRIRKNGSFFEDERNLLFTEFIRMVEKLRPKVFIIENVPGILSYDKGNVRKEIEEKLSQIGYDVSSRVLSAEKFGVPQRRKRAIFIGNRLGIDSNTLFPAETHNENTVVTVWDAISDLPRLQSGEGEELSSYLTMAQNEYQKDMRNTSEDYYRNHISTLHANKTIEILKMISQGQTIRDLAEKFHTKSVHSGAYGRMKKNEPSYTLTTRINTPSVGRITHPIDDRTITPREAARLQSYPDNYYFIGDITSIGKQIGNSVPPLLAKAIGETILEKLFDRRK